MSKFLRFLCLVGLAGGAAVAMFGLQPTLDGVRDYTVAAVQYCCDLPLYSWLREKAMPFFGLMTAPISQDEHAVKLPDLHQFARQAQDTAPTSPTSADLPKESEEPDDTTITHDVDPASQPDVLSQTRQTTDSQPATTRRRRELPAYYFIIEDEENLKKCFNCTPDGHGWIVSLKSNVPENFFFLFSTVFTVDVDGENYDRSMPITKNTKGLIRVHYAD